MSALKLRAIGNSVGVVLPKDVLSKLDVAAGDTLYVVEAPAGAITLTKSDPAFEADMAVARRIMKERYAVLRELAK